jgi:hypothetical protein
MNENESGVSLHIERLVLDGLPVSVDSVGQLQTAIQSELGRLLTENRFVQTTPSAMHRISAPGFQVGSDSAPTDLGKQIARSVFQSFNPSA